MSSKAVNIFVYGTLKRNEPNHFALKNLNCKFVRTASTIDFYPLVIATRYSIPFLLNKKGLGKSIVGEIYEMDEKQLPSLDKFESCPFLYNRETLTVVAGNGDEACKMQAYSYLLPRFPHKLLDLPFLSDYHATEKYVLHKDRPEQITKDNCQEFLEEGLK